MKRRLSVIALVLSGYFTMAQDYTITNWLDNKECATVMTFDDWDPSAPGMAVDKMINAGLPGTFFVTIDNAWRSTDYPDMINAVNNGIEIANHTVTHPNLTTVSPTALYDEVEGARATLDANVTNQKITTFSYPLGAYNSTVLNQTKVGHVGARAVSATTNNWGYDFPTTEDEYYQFPTVQVGNLSPFVNFTWEINQARAGGGLYTIMYHSVGGLGWFDDITEAVFDQQIAYIQGIQNEVWITTFSNAVRYHKEKHCATLNSLSKGIATWTLELTDTLSDDATYNQELTIWLELDASDVVSDVKQNGVSIA